MKSKEKKTLERFSGNETLTFNHPKLHWWLETSNPLLEIL